MKKYILEKQVHLKVDEAKGKYYAFMLETGEHYNLNQTGYTILKLLKKELGVNEIIKKVSEQMSVNEKTFSKEIIDFLDLSQKNGIIVCKQAK